MVFDDVVFALVTLPFAFVVVVVDEFVEPFVTFVVVVFVVVVVPFALLVVVVVLLTELPELATLAPLSLGQAAPNKPNVKTAERAITFFISIIFSCLLQRMYVYIFV